MAMPKPILKIAPRTPDRIYCDACEKDWSKRGKTKVRKVDTDVFKAAANKWQSYEHLIYNKVYERVDWSRSDLTLCKTCDKNYFHDKWRESFSKKDDSKSPQPQPPSPDQANYSTASRKTTPIEQQAPVRSSSRKRSSFETNRNVDEEKKCIICNSIKMDEKGHILPVSLITLRPKDPKKKHIAEETLLRFAKIHQKHNTMYKAAADRILLVSTMRSLFTADVGYHMKQCYIPFRGKHFEVLEYPKEPEIEPDLQCQDSLKDLIELVRLHVICRREVYSLLDLRKAYDEMKTEACPILRVGDIKSRIIKVFPNDILIQECKYLNKNQEYVFPSSSTLTPDVLEAAASGFGLSKTASFRSAANRLHNSIISAQNKKSWPPTPQEIIEDEDPFQIDTFNFLAWIVDPRAPIGEDGLVKLESQHKARKIGELCRNVESLLPNGQPSMDQILFSIILHRNTGKREPLDIAHGYGYGISYTETRFIEDVWAEWDREQNSNIPSNIKKHVNTTVVADNIDWKDKNISGCETHNTNIILIQHSSCLENSGSKAHLKPNYQYSRDRQRAFKASETSETYFSCPKVNPEKFSNNENVAFEGIEYVQASRKTIAWLLCRQGNVGNDIVPAWSAFQTLTTKKPDLCKVNVGYHPAIHDTPTKYGTIMKVLKTTEDIMKELELGFIFLEVDQAIYTKVMDLKFHLFQNRMNSFEKIIIRMGGFHIIMCLMKSIYSWFHGFGFTELLAQVGRLGGPGTIAKSLSGGDVKGGIRLYKLLFEALYRIKLRNLELTTVPENNCTSSMIVLVQKAREDLSFKTIQNLISSVNIDCFETSAGGDMAFWLDSFLEMVNMLLNIIHFQRTGNWKGFMEAIYKFLPYCFGINRKNYARNLSFYYLDMIDLKVRNKEAYEYLDKGGFSGSLTGSLHSNIPMDQIIETTINRMSKSVGGMSGKTEDKGACEKWVRLNPYLCALKEHMDHKLKISRSTSHIELGYKRKQKDEKDVKSIVDTLDEWVPQIYSKPLINISNGKLASPELIKNAKSVKKRGEDARDSFFSRISTQEGLNREQVLYYRDTIKQQTLKTFADKPNKVKKFIIPEDEGQAFGDILSRYDQKILDLEFLCSYPITSRPWSICNEEERSRTVSKAAFRNSLQELCPIKAVNVNQAPEIHTFIVDAMKIVQMISIINLTPSTFLTWTKSLLSYIMNLKGDEIHIVFDQYSETVDLNRPSKGRSSVGERKYVSSLTQVLPSTRNDWNVFLTNNANKCRLVQLITDYILSDEFVAPCPVYVTQLNHCVLKNTDGSLTDVPELSCTHKEADPRLALHAIYASKLHPGESVAVVADDTDVFIILLSVVRKMEGELFFRQGKFSVGKGIEFHNVMALAAVLGEHCCHNLPGFHALTGSDFTFPFFGHTKFRIFSLMLNLKKAKSRKSSLHLLNSLGTEKINFDELIDFILHTIYNRPLKEKSPKDSRLALLHVGKGKTQKYRSTKLLPPDKSSMMMKIKRSNLVTFSWKNCLNTLLQPMKPTEYGWEVIDNSLVPIWFEGDSLPSDEEYNTHIKEKLMAAVAVDIEMEEEDDSDASDNDCDSDEYPISESDSSSDEGDV